MGKILEIPVPELKFKAGDIVQPKCGGPKGVVHSHAYNEDEQIGYKVTYWSKKKGHYRWAHFIDAELE